MAGLYLHIPFCKSKCAYCNFFSVVSEKQRVDFLEALKKEALMRKDYLGGEEVRTIYFGGGTPSTLRASEISEILEVLNKNYKTAAAPEITLEANPDTVSKESLLEYKSIGINRLSIGIQSFFDDDLQYLSRRHDSKHALQVLEWAKEVGFQEVTLDLIYGIPTLTDEKWRKNLEIFFSTGFNHLSAYALTVEEKTALGQRINKGVAAPVSEDAIIRQYEILCELTDNQGFEHYEISNFARPGHYSKHNTIYWKGEKYLGLGPSAHSFDGVSRQWNVASIKDYCDNYSFEREQLTLDDRYNEYVMTSLRTCWGCNLEYIRQNFGEKYAKKFENGIKNHILSGKMFQKDQNFILNDNGMLFADGIAAELFATRHFDRSR
ncbi:MAG: radical SAM family heme chaperone HemW [Bacteroidales bacterium]|nr:radical SAM family heme chaperone HemW [Bacteroidales bacterium]